MCPTKETLQSANGLGRGRFLSGNFTEAVQPGSPIKE
jgi:hypothetical protein